MLWIYRQRAKHAIALRCVNTYASRVRTKCSATMAHKRFATLGRNARTQRVHYRKVPAKTWDLRVVWVADS